MRLIDADKLSERYPELADKIATAPTEEAILLPFKPGDYCWHVDEEDGYKIKMYDELIEGVAYYGNDRFEVISRDGERCPVGESYCCISREQAMEVREQMLSQLTLKDIEKSIKFSQRESPEEWEPFMDALKELFRKKVNSLI